MSIEMTIECVIGLGTNLGDRLEQLRRAILLLTEHNILSGCLFSAIYETEALLLPNSPESWNIPFLNMAVRGATRLSPHALLAACKEIERDMGRNSKNRWAPREIDLDILVYGREAVLEEQLTIPHMALGERAFALLPLQDVWPHWQHPVTSEEVEAMAARLPEASGGIVKTALAIE